MDDTDFTDGTGKFRRAGGMQALPVLGAQRDVSVPLARAFM